MKRCVFPRSRRQKLDSRDVVAIAGAEGRLNPDQLNLSGCGIDVVGATALADPESEQDADLAGRQRQQHQRWRRQGVRNCSRDKTLSALDLSETALLKQKWMIYAAIQCKRIFRASGHHKGSAGCLLADGALRRIQIKDNFLGPSGEELVTRAMEKPAVVAESARGGAGKCALTPNLGVARRRCDSSCTWCDNPGNGDADG